MEIIRCDSSSEAARKAFRLRYQVYAHELRLDDPYIDHKNEIYEDSYDKHSRIYVALKDGEAIATVRALYDREYDFVGGLPESIRSMLGLENFLAHYSKSLSISTRFAISPNHRGSLAANLVTARMFRDFIDEDINFVFSWCAPYLFNFYSQLGFHMYKRSVSDKDGLWTPIVLPIRDWKYLQEIQSPLRKQIDKTKFDDPVHPSVEWFRGAYGELLETFVANYDENILTKIFTFGGDQASKIDHQDISIFSGMSAADIKKIVGSGKLLRFKSGQTVIESGQVTNEMFIVIDGEIRISLKGSDQLSFKIGPGQVFGEVSMLSRALRTADCVATQNTQLAIISRQNLQRLMRVEPELSTQLLFNLAASLSLKLRRTNEYIEAQKKLAYWPSLVLEIRTHLNISQKDLAGLLDITEESVAQWEAGAEIPPVQIQKAIEKIAADKNITSLGGMLEMVRNSPTRMFIVDEDYFVIATSQTSEWIENTTIEEQLTENARPHFDVIFQKLSDTRFWRGSGGQVIEYEFLNDNKTWRSVITSVIIRGRIYALVQQAVS